jgi:hypothetical protein
LIRVGEVEEGVETGKRTKTKALELAQHTENQVRIIVFEDLS